MRLDQVTAIPRNAISTLSSRWNGGGNVVKNTSTAGTNDRTSDSPPAQYASAAKLINSDSTPSDHDQNTVAVTSAPAPHASMIPAKNALGFPNRAPNSRINPTI